MKRIVRGATLLLENDPPQLNYLDTFQSVGGKVWPASELMVNYLAASGAASGKKVIELGSGCGYVGLACAVLGATHVTLTDRTITQRNLVHDMEGMLLEEIMPPNRLLLDICQRNINENKASYLSSLLNVHELEWGDENMQHIDSLFTANVAYDIVIGSDVTYHEELSESLFWTVSKLLQHMELQRNLARQNTNRSGPNVDQAHERVRFITAHQYRMDSATALTLSTAKRFGLNCTVLATSIDTSTMKIFSDGVEGQERKLVTYSTTDTTVKQKEEDDKKFVIWQFTL